jgi:hypothetical protein
MTSKQTAAGLTSSSGQSASKLSTPAAAKVYDDEDAIQNLSDAEDDAVQMSQYMVKSSSRRYTTGPGESEGDADDDDDEDEVDEMEEEMDEDGPRTKQRVSAVGSDANSNETESINHIDEEQDELDEDENDDDDDNNEQAGEDCNNNSTKITVRAAKITVKASRGAVKAKVKTRGVKAAHDSSPAAVVVAAAVAVKPSGNPDEPVYCMCQEISYGQMIGCDNDACRIEWFHFQCVKLTMKPKGKWYCPECRGDSHRVMRKAHQAANGGGGGVSASAATSSFASASPSTYYAKQK